MGRWGRGLEQFAGIADIEQSAHLGGVRKPGGVVAENPVFRDVQKRILRVGCSNMTEIPIQGEESRDYQGLERFELRSDAHLIDDETVAKMGHPDLG